MRYLIILKEQIKLSFMAAAAYRANFLLMLLQSMINSFMGILAVDFIYSNVSSIAGWSKNEMIILLCTSLIVNQLYRGIINHNHLRFLGNVANGSFDRMLVKPMSIIFQINTGKIDFSSFFSLIAPVAVLIIQISILGLNIKWANIVMFLVFVMNALVLLTSLMLLLYSLVFVFIQVNGLSNIYFILMSISEKPKEIFRSKVLLDSFTFIIPVMLLANVPVSILLGKSNSAQMFLAIGTTILFSVLSVIAIKVGISKYSSASS